MADGQTLDVFVDLDQFELSFKREDGQVPMIVNGVTIEWTVEMLLGKIREQLPPTFQDVDIIL